MLLIMLIYFAIFADSYDAVIISFAIGFAADISGMVLGPHIISFGLIGSGIAHIRKFILLKSTGQQAIAILVSGILSEVIAMLFIHLKASDMLKAGFSEVFAVSLYSAILWFLLKWPVKTVGKWTGVGVHRFGANINQRV